MNTKGLEVQITKKDLITWAIAILVPSFGLAITGYSNISSRVKLLEITVHTLDIKYSQHDKLVTETRNDLKDIKNILYELNTKVEVSKSLIGK